MRTELSALMPVLEGFTSRASTSDGRAGQREPLPFERAVAVEPATEFAPALDLHDTLQGRRSTLRYAPLPVRTDVILGLVRAALAADEGDWGLDAGPLEAFVFAFLSEGLAPGVYRVTARDCDRVASLAELGPAENLGIQREFSTASGIVAMYANLDQADSWAGAHGYRVCAVRAAMATYEINLRYQALGLVGTLFGGFIPSSVRRLLHADGVTRQPLLAATYGHPEA